MERQEENLESWKDIVGYEGWYKISSFGSVMRVKSSRNTHVGKRLKQMKSPNGYCFVHLSKNGKIKTEYVADLVCKSFIGERSKGLEKNHKNGIKHDNRICNLEYVTHIQNGEHALKNGLLRPQRGEKHSHAKLKNEDIHIIRKLYDFGLSQSKISSIFNVSRPAISLIIGEKIGNTFDFMSSM